MATEKNKANRGTLAKILRRIGRYRYLMVLSILLALLSVAMTLYVPILIGDAIDLMAAGPLLVLDEIVALLLRAGVLVGLTALCQWLMASINNRITYRVVRDLREEAFAKLQRLPLSYLDVHSQGDTVSRVINDVDQFADGLLLGFTQLFTGVLTILGTLCFMLMLSWQIALVVVLLTPLSLFIARFISGRTYRMFHAQSEARGRQTAYIDEMIGNQKIVVAFSHEQEAADTFDGINRELGRASLSAMFFSSLTNPTTRFVNSVVYAAVALAGALTAIATAGATLPFTVGKLSCLLSYTNQYTKPFNEISGVATEFQNALACASRILEIVEEPGEQPDPADAAVLTDARGAVELQQVSFSYSESRPLIEQLSVSIRPGERVAIVGPTGCGKTTLINLLMRFYDVRSGAITVDGTDIRQMTRHSLRSSYGMVLQETWLSGVSVRDNIRMGRPDATDDEVVAAARASHAHSFIKRLSHGYDTVIGQGDGNLSEGQKQLLCITRVMLCLPPMLILDEATSSIDTRTELKIQEAFGRMMQGRTSFIVAHRLSTVRTADTILVMRDGHIVEMGNHEQLLRQNGFYAELYRSQFAH